MAKCESGEILSMASGFSKKAKKSKEQDLQRSKNLILAEEVLSELRNFVDSEESSGSFNSFKTIQQKWKDLGDVPSQNSRTLWANYNALIHRFYDQRSIYFELKELDRKKNYESKLILCEKAEALVSVENLREAIKGLNDLHHEFKHLGPVPQEVQEELWQQFKASSDKVYDRRKAFVHEGSNAWVNSQHTYVPGPDGKKGFGGKCFPKDTKGLKATFEEYEVEAPVLNSAIKANKKRRE